MVILRNWMMNFMFKCSYLRIVIFQVIEVCLSFEEQLHDCRGIWHELEQKGQI